MALCLIVTCGNESCSIFKITYNGAIDNVICLTLGMLYV